MKIETAVYISEIEALLPFASDDETRHALHEDGGSTEGSAMTWLQNFLRNFRSKTTEALERIEKAQAMNQAELLEQLGKIGKDLNEAKDEILAALNAQGTVSPEVEAAVNKVGGVATELANLANPATPTT